MIGFSILPDQYKDRYQTVTEAELDASSQTRLTAWRHGMSMVLSRPLFGVGIGCFGIANAADFGLWLKSHSLYVQVPSETGLVGAAVFFCFLVAMLRLNRSTTAQLRKQKDAWKFERCVLDGIFAGLVTLLVAGVFGHSLLRPTWYIYAALGLAAYRVHMDYLRASVSSRREESNHA